MSGLGHLEIELFCEAPTRIGGVGADVWRNSNGRACIPATTLKGCSRLETERLAKSLSLRVCSQREPCDSKAERPPCVVCALFGNRQIEGRVYFADLVADNEPVLAARKQVPHSRARGVAIDWAAAREPRRLLTLPAGTRCIGTVRHRIAEAENWQLALLVLGLRAIAQVGAGYGIGWGVCRVEVREVPLNTLLRALRARVG